MNDPKRNCPLTRMYWAYLARHEDKLSDNPRLRVIYGSLRRRSDAERKEDAATFDHVSSTLAQGATTQP